MAGTKAINFDFGLDVDFDLSDFKILDDGSETEEEPQQHVRIMPPRIDKAMFTHVCTFDNALAFAKQVSLQDGARTFAWVSGNFVFGDLVEALITARNIYPTEIYISSLSIDPGTISSLRNVLQLCPGCKLYLLLSGYWYSTQKAKHTATIDQLYQELDTNDNRLQVIFGNYHTKIITMATEYGNTLTIHGSANLCSSNSIEQIMVEVNNRELHEFNAQIMRGLCDRFGTINFEESKRILGVKSWQAVAEKAVTAAEAAQEAARVQQQPGGGKSSKADEQGQMCASMAAPCPSDQGG